MPFPDTKKKGQSKSKQNHIKLGRPRDFPTPSDLQFAIQSYLDTTPFAEYTVTGLALSLGTSRQVLCDYQEREGYSAIVDEAKLIVEHSYEVDLKQKGQAGTIFALKQFNWRDQLDLGGNLDVSNLTDDQLDKKIAESEARLRGDDAK